MSYLQLLLIALSVVLTLCCDSGQTGGKRPLTHEAVKSNIKVYDAQEDPLYLTPFIEEGFLEEARGAAKVISPPFNSINSYSGFITVNKTFDKNMFIWFFPSKNEEDPVMLWLQGGPGLTSLFGLFSEIGPFQIENDTVAPRNETWCNSHSILFIDNPVGTGYSFTKEGGLPHDEIQIGEELYEALRQFFELFPELRKNDFFVAGESYAGKYVPIISDKISRANYDLPNSLRINLKGLAIGNGWLDPINQMNIGEYTFQLGLVDSKTKSRMDECRDKSIELLHQGHLVNSTLVQREITTIFKNATAYDNLYNYLLPADQKTEDIVESFVQRKEVRRAIHVGNLTFNPDELVDTALQGDIMVSVANILADLLENYRVLIYSGQLDLAVPYPTTVNYLEKLKFTSAEEYRAAERRIWYKKDDIAGYVKTAGNLTDIMILNAGHLVPMDQPEVAFEMIYNFTRNKNIGSK
ncbi:hypothetical protein HHI36_016677 [Cryptolaemus montrouzieri]|uniref:Carboxypeptidase n=1 Tax=Cryptolaemus montrouzieri TaxID=559131 RepID=A0ABD2NKI6_9CUCU